MACLYAVILKVLISGLASSSCWHLRRKSTIGWLCRHFCSEYRRIRDTALALQRLWKASMGVTCDSVVSDVTRRVLRVGREEIVWPCSQRSSPLSGDCRSCLPVSRKMENATGSVPPVPPATGVGGVVTAANITRNMSDSQLKEALSTLASAASAAGGDAHTATYLKNINSWSSSSLQPMRSAKSRPARPPIPPVYQPPPPVLQPLPIAPAHPPNPARPPLPSHTQALHSTYASRSKTGVTLLVQPILAQASASNLRTSRRTVNYTEPGSGDEFPDAGAIESDDSDFVASGGTRMSVRQSRSRMATGMSVFNATTGSSSTPRPAAPTPKPDKLELDKSYLGMMPPAQAIQARLITPTAHEYYPFDSLERQAQRRTSLIPIRVEFETETHRIRDCFMWNLNEMLIPPETFAGVFCKDLDIPKLWADTIAAQIRTQLEEHEGVASMDLGIDGAFDIDAPSPNGEESPECRVILSIDVQIANYHLLDHIEWDLLSPLTPEEFSAKLCTELGLAGEAVPLIAHAIHEELIKHKKDAIEWGVIGGERSDAIDDHATFASATAAGVAGVRDRVGHGLMKDKTGLGLGLGRAPRDGRGPKTLRSVWRDWPEADEFRTVFEELTAEDIEKREIERERSSRRLRRETSKFQSSTRTRRR